MYVYGELLFADLHNLGADPSAGKIGRVYWNTVSTKVMVDDGTNIYAMLRNDGKAIIGNNGTANSNVRFHRGAAGVLQLVLGGDATAEGTLSTSLAQISAKLENYVTGSLPAAANAGRLAMDTTVTSPKFDTGAAWITLSPLTTRGDLYVRGASDNSRLAIGTANKVLFSDGTDPTWGLIVNAYIDAAAAIARSKLASGTNYRILANSSAGVMSENAALTPAHVIFADANGQLSGEAALAISRGGTGQATATLGFDALSPMTTLGDLIYGGASGTRTRLGIGSSGQVLKQVGGLPTWATFSGGINYLSSNPDAEADTSGWVTYGNTAQNTPVSGTGGSPVSTWTRVTSSPLRGSGSFLWTRTAANRQGEGVSFPFTLDNADLAKPLLISFDYKNVSGTFFAANGTTAPLNDATTSVNAGMSDLEVFVYDVTNSALIPVSPQVLTSSSTLPATYKGIFQTSATGTSYRLIIHTARSTAVAFTQQFDNFYLGPDTAAYGAAVTDWVAYTPTFTGMGTVTNTKFYSRRVGDSLEVTGSFVMGTPTATQAQMTLGYNGVNANVVTDTTKVSNAASQQQYLSPVIGYTANTDLPVAMATDTNQNYIVFSIKNATNGGAAPLNGSVVFASGASSSFSLSFRIPIVGWSSTVQMSNDTDTRVVAARYKTATAGSYANDGSFNIIDFGTQDHDTSGSVTTGASWKFTAPVSGKYVVDASILIDSAAWTAGPQRQLSLYKNGSAFTILNRQTFYASVTDYGPLLGTATINLVAGDYIDIRMSHVRAGGTVGLIANNSYNYVDIYRLSGPAAIAATESVNARASAATTSITSATPIVINGTSTHDSHGAYSISTGRFTCPTSGKYRVTGKLSLSSVAHTAGNAIELYCYKNGSVYSTMARHVIAANQTAIFDVGGSDEVSCVAGDILDVRGYSDTTSSARGGSQNYVCFTRVGN